MKRLSLFSQILAINALLVTATVFVAAIAVDLSVGDAGKRREFLVLVLALLVTLLANALLLRRRLQPLERLIRTMEETDLTVGGGRAQASRADADEVVRLQGAFNRMLDRLEQERREAGRNVLRAHEQERQRLAQDLHDEVNQALTAILLRLEAAIQAAPRELRLELETTKQLATQAMEELLHLARELRPTALDDHGLLPALRTQVQDFAEQTGIDASFRRRGEVPALTDEQQLVVYRVTQESLSNIVQHAAAGRVIVELSSIGRTVLRITDNGRGLDGGADGRAPARDGGLGLSGMRERALLAGGELSIHSTEGSGTVITLTMS
jgi:two-component system, NarL family, sensor histidine kinase UhpB